MNIAILLSTYNGGLFLEEQINSILNQSFINWDLYIRDDGSTDGTLHIVEKYCEKYSNIHFLKDDGNKGACKSFLWLLKKTEANYYMFCDQDDIWLPSKIQLSLEKMKDTENNYMNIPILVHTDLKVVDINLKEISPSFWKYAKLKQNYLSQFNYLGACNGVTGCTIMINNEAKIKILPASPKAPMHDYWMALKIAQTGRIVHVDTPTILYRQHDRNELGAKNTDKSYFFTKLKRIGETVKNQWRVYKFLKQIHYGSLFKFYWYKITYTMIRNI